MTGFAELFLRFISLILGIGEEENFPPPLTAAEERENFVKMHEGDGKARAALIEHNLRLVSHIIRKYYASAEDPDELLSIGSFGLIKAVDTFKYDLGNRFATYAAKCIQNEILMHFRASKKYAREISLNETIDMDRDGNPLTYLDVIATEDNMEDDIDLKDHVERIRDLVNTVLDEREKQIVVLRYGLEGYRPRTQREVAKYRGISRSYVSRIEKRALEKLKAAFGGVIPEFDS